MTHSEPSPIESCPNCAHPACGPYCPQCGQKIHIETPTLWEFVHEYLHHYVALDGALTRTLGLLIARPGKLTSEFLAGRRQRYIKPLQLYITISFIFFVLLSLVEGSASVQRTGNTADLPPVAAADAGSGPAPDLGLKIEVDEHSVLRNWAQRVNRKGEQLSTNPDEVVRDTAKKMLQRAPYGVFALMPIFALLLFMLLRGRRLRYGAHLVFSLHFHAFVFLLFLLMLLPLPLGGIAAVAGYAYLVVALRTVYGGRWLPQILRAAVLSGLYTVCVAVMTVLLILVALGA